MSRQSTNKGRSDLSKPSFEALPRTDPLGLSPLHGPPRSQHLVLVLGVGPGMGLALARAFAEQGYATVIMSRNKAKLDTWAKELDETARSRRKRDGEEAIDSSSGSTLSLSRAVACDVLSTDSVKAALVEAMAAFPGYRLGTAIYNASVRQKKPFLEQTDAHVTDSLQASVASAFAFMQACIRSMLTNGDGVGGNILATGATSATRGRAGFAAFSAGKTGLRRLCEVAAREYGPAGIHVSHVVVDGLIDSQTARDYLGLPKGSRFPDASVVLPSEAAKSYVFLAQQQSSGWTFEMDLRPAREHF
ncbi:unnamed protein product [Jaminaea pallidilutea]